MEKDLVIIGGGPGGYTAAIRAAQLGAKVALVEKERMGGTCLNKGCIPTKSLYKDAQVLNTIKKADDFGVEIDSWTFDFAKIQERKSCTVNRLVSGIEQLMKSNDIELVYGLGSIKDNKTVTVQQDGGQIQHISSKNILIASGSLPIRPHIPGMDLSGVITSDDLLETERLPKSIVIIGGGVIGIELASILNAMGTKVTIVEYMPRILPTTDTEIVKRLTMYLKKTGISIETGVCVTEVLQKEDGLSVIGQGKKEQLSLHGEKVLVATGRRINTDGLNLLEIGIEHDKKGIKVDEVYSTNIQGIYAIGDVIGGQMLAHVAAEEGKAVAENIMGYKGHVNYKAVPSCIFSFPEVASVGMTEDQATEKELNFSSFKFMFAANGKALTMAEEEGFIKVLVCRDTNKILGVHIIGAHASDLIHEATLAIHKELKVEDITSMIHAHPTLSECFLEAVMGTQGSAIHAVPTKEKLKNKTQK